jgi:large subunit ribosomal protein L17
MRHGVSVKKFGRRTSWRKATVRDLARATLKEQKITTTLVRAKEARKLVDRLITMAKGGTLADKRQAFRVLCDHQLVSDLFLKIGLRFRQRPGGYTRIIPLGYRRGDNAQMAILELTEREQEIAPKPKKSTAKAKTALPAPDAKQALAEPVKAEKPQEEKPAAPKPAPGKEPVKKVKPIPEQVKAGKKIVGGIRRMFQRKTGES